MTCLVCGGVDDDIRLGWSICRTCFRIDDPIQEWPDPPWIHAVRLVSVLLFTIAVVFLVGALAELTP